MITPEILSHVRPGESFNMPGSACSYDEIEWLEPGTSKPTEAEIEAGRIALDRTKLSAKIAIERQRRLALGFDYNFGDSRGVHHIGTTPADMVGWSEVSTYAGALLDMGDVETKIAIVTDTGPCEVTAPEWRAIEVAAAAFRQPIWARSFVLSQSLPTDYTADAHWK